MIKLNCLFKNVFIVSTANMKYITWFQCLNYEGIHKQDCLFFLKVSICVVKHVYNVFQNLPVCV